MTLREGGWQIPIPHHLLTEPFNSKIEVLKYKIFYQMFGDLGDMYDRVMELGELGELALESWTCVGGVRWALLCWTWVGWDDQVMEFWT